MTATTHALIGGVITQYVPDPTIGISLSAISHPIVDIIPHWDFGLGWKSKKKALLFCQTSADFIFGVILTFLIFGNTTNHLYLLICILISESWDILQMPYLLLNWKFLPFSAFYHVGSATNNKAGMFWGVISQIATVGVLVLILRTIH
ncbi:MAG: hypothetical protein PHE48_03605 [Candidatus Daviesbacteria bacterium]|nr:hypothetical protein [Candidatus Daviesbacteria bacterium]